MKRIKARTWALTTVVGLSLLTGLLACGEATLKAFTPTPTPFTGTDKTFRTGVLQVFLTKDCAPSAGGCHSFAGTPAGLLGLGGGGRTPDDIYAAVMAGGVSQTSSTSGAAVNLLTPANSLLLTEPLSETGQQDHSGGALFPTITDLNYLSIVGWIEEGAQNN